MLTCCPEVCFNSNCGTVFVSSTTLVDTLMIFCWMLYDQSTNTRLLLDIQSCYRQRASVLRPFIPVENKTNPSSLLTSVHQKWSSIICKVVVKQQLSLNHFIFRLFRLYTRFTIALLSRTSSYRVTIQH